MIIAIYVNNFLICSAEKKEINNIKEALKLKFHMSDLGLVSFFLEMTLTQDCANQILGLGQQVYIKKILQDHGMWDCKAVAVLMNGALFATLPDYQATGNFGTQYQSAVGLLIYTMLYIWPDLAF